MNFDPVIAEIHRVYNLAEQYIKLIERESEEDGLAVPPVNELRYAGQHLCRALVESEEAARDKHFQDALDHCRRACYDACEIRLEYYLNKCILFQADYSQVGIGGVLPSYLDDRGVLNTINRATSSRNRESRAQYFNDIEKDTETIRTLSERWENARPELNKKIEKERRDNRRYIVGVVVGIFGIVMTVIFGALALLRG